MVAKEFLRRCIASLQNHRHKMWTIISTGGVMMLHPQFLSDDIMKMSLKALFVVDGAPELHHEVTPLYSPQERDEILKRMPRFDQWGPCPEGLVGERPNLLVPVPVSELED
jgi:hypothetical protein